MGFVFEWAHYLYQGAAASTKSISLRDQRHTSIVSSLLGCCVPGMVPAVLQIVVQSWCAWLQGSIFNNVPILIRAVIRWHLIKHMLQPYSVTDYICFYLYCWHTINVFNHDHRRVHAFAKSHLLVLKVHTNLITVTGTLWCHLFGTNGYGREVNSKVALMVENYRMLRINTNLWKYICYTYIQGLIRKTVI